MDTFTSEEVSAGRYNTNEVAPEKNSCFLHSAAAHVPTVRRDRTERRQVWLFGFILMWHDATGIHVPFLGSWERDTHGRTARNHGSLPQVQSSAKRRRPGLVNFVSAVAYHSCLSLPAAFTQHTYRDWLKVSPVVG